LDLIGKAKKRMPEESLQELQKRVLREDHDRIIMTKELIVLQKQKISLEIQKLHLELARLKENEV
jgi:hypothetical protein